MKQTLQSKARRGIKDDSSLHEFEREVRRRREALGLPPVDNDFDPHETIAEWHREQGLTPPWERSLRKKASPQKDKRHIREKKLAAYLESHLDKLSAQGKPLPKTSGRIKKIKIAAAR